LELKKIRAQSALIRQIVTAENGRRRKALADSYVDFQALIVPNGLSKWIKKWIEKGDNPSGYGKTQRFRAK